MLIVWLRLSLCTALDWGADCTLQTMCRRCADCRRQKSSSFLGPRQGRRNRIDRPAGSIRGFSFVDCVQAAALLTQGRATWAGSMWEGYGAPESGWMMSLVQVHRSVEQQGSQACPHKSMCRKHKQRWGTALGRVCAGPPCTVLGLGPSLQVPS